MRCAVLLLVLFTPSAFAESDPVELDPIVVTASRGAQPLRETLASVTVIARPDIERLQARDFQDLVRGLPGLQVTNYGGSGKATSLFLRGSNSDHITVLIDGIRMGSTTLGNTAFEQFPLDQIERIEIVRGPRSSLYGPDAIGGVIQIFTRRGLPNEDAEPWFSVGRGSFDSGSIEGGIRGSLGTGGWYSLGLNTHSTDGIDVQPSSGETDRDGYRGHAGALNLGWSFASGAEIAANLLRAVSRSAYDGSTVNVADNAQQVIGARTRFMPFDFWGMTLVAGQSRDLSDNFHDSSDSTVPTTPLTSVVVAAISDPLFPQTLATPVLLAVLVEEQIFNTYRDNYSWQNDFSLSDQHVLSVGVDQLEDRVDGNTPYSVSSRDNTGIFAQYRGELAAHELQASLRRDDNEQFGRHQTGSAAYGYRFASGLKLSAQHGRAFKAPSFNALYYPGLGDPDLKPELARSSELGASGAYDNALGTGTWAVNAYYSEIENLIYYVPPTYGAVNIGKAAIRGAEAQLSAQWRDWRALAAYTWLDPRNRSGDANHGKQLPLRARHSGRLDLDYDLMSGARPLSLGATINGVGRRYNDASNELPLHGYALLDARISWQALERWQLQFKAANLLDTVYESIATYAQPGRSYFFTLRYQP